MTSCSLTACQNTARPMRPLLPVMTILAIENLPIRQTMSNDIRLVSSAGTLFNVARLKCRCPHRSGHPIALQHLSLWAQSRPWSFSAQVSEPCEQLIHRQFKLLT